MTLTEKILARHAGKRKVFPGEFIEVEVDFAYGNDITFPLAIEKFKRWGGKKVFSPERIGIIPDHFTPAKDIASAEQCRILREFAEKYEIPHYFEVGRCGIEHIFLPEQGLVKPGELIVGADSHTCTLGALGAFSTGVGSSDLACVLITGKIWLKVPPSIKFVYYGKLRKWVTAKDIILFTLKDIGVDGATYRTMEFAGETISSLSMPGRFTLCNMVVEGGAKNGIIEPDEKTLNFGGGNFKGGEILKSDPEAHYEEIKEYSISRLEPQVALPPLPSRAKPVDEIGNILIDQVVIGSCTNGWLEDLRLAGKVLKGKKVHPEVRLLVFPGTPRIYQEALREGLIEIFLEAGGVVGPSTCGPCLGGHMGILASGERVVSTTNRNFVGRMGHPKSEVYLASPAVAAASAVKGRIIHPREVVGE